MSLVSRLSMVILLPFLALYTAYILTELYRSREAAYQEFQQYADSLADITAQSTATMIWNLDYPTLLGATTSLTEDSRITGVLFTLYATMANVPDDSFLIVGSLPGQKDIIREGSVLDQVAPAPNEYGLLLERDIVMHDRPLGKAYFYFQTSQIQQSLAQEAKSLILLAGLFILSYLVTVFWMMNRYFTRPFQKVHSLALDVSESFSAIQTRFEQGKELEANMLPDTELLLRRKGVDLARKDEVGDFTRSFVTMVNSFSILLTELSEHARVIRDMNESLEERINERTRELQSSNQALSSSLKVLKQTQATLVQQEKLASIGQLAAGVAHEINNPIGYIGSNLNRLQEYFSDIQAVLNAIDTSIIQALPEEQRKEAVARLNAIKQEFDYDFLMQDLPELLDDCHEGSGRVREIVQNLKDYSRTDNGDTKTDADLNDLINRALKLVWNELKYDCEVHFSAGDVPKIPVNIGQIGQVVSNLLINASQAIRSTGNKGDIRIETWADKTDAWIRVSDNGCGIEPDNIGKIFDPFFTTKPVGEGTGLGMNISWDIIVNKHQGHIGVESDVGKGAVFTIRLPLQLANQLEASA